MLCPKKFAYTVLTWHVPIDKHTKRNSDFNGVGQIIYVITMEKSI